MKTSTKLLAGAVVILIIAIGIYNNALKAEYSTGHYKLPYRNYKLMALKGFSKVEINGAGLVEVEFKQGDFAVYNSKNNNDSLQFVQIGDKLTINVNLAKDMVLDTNRETGVVIPVVKYSGNYNHVTIICPRLTAITTSDVFLLNGKPAGKQSVAINTAGTKGATVVKDYSGVKNGFYNNLPELGVSGFKLDSLTVNQNAGTKLYLQNSVIGNLKVLSGPFSAVEIDYNNTIKSADLKMKAGSQLLLNNVLLPKLSYQISDSARVSISGASLKSFIK